MDDFFCHFLITKIVSTSLTRTQCFSFCRKISEIKKWPEAKVCIFSQREIVNPAIPCSCTRSCAIIFSKTF